MDLKGKMVYWPRNLIVRDPDVQRALALNKLCDISRSFHRKSTQGSGMEMTGRMEETDSRFWADSREMNVSH